MATTGKIILIDADVVSHFVSADAADVLPAIFPYPIKVLDKVYAELARIARIKRIVDDLIDRQSLDVIPFPEHDFDIVKEYFHIKTLLFKGDGEAACMAVARYTNDIIASSNLRDIRHYCKTHGIVYISTMDFLCKAVRRGIFTERQCDEFIRKVRAVGSKLPVERMRDFSCRDLEL